VNATVVVRLGGAELAREVVPVTIGADVVIHVDPLKFYVVIASLVDAEVEKRLKATRELVARW